MPISVVTEYLSSSWGLGLHLIVSGEPVIISLFELIKGQQKKIDKKNSLRNFNKC